MPHENWPFKSNSLDNENSVFSRYFISVYPRGTPGLKRLSLCALDLTQRASSDCDKGNLFTFSPNPGHNRASSNATSCTDFPGNLSEKNRNSAIRDARGVL